MKEEIYKEKSREYCRQLAKIAEKKNITHDIIAERTNFQRSNVTRMLSGRYSPTLENFIKLMEAIGVKLALVDNSHKLIK
jgi:DNA-binding phage protein